MLEDGIESGERNVSGGVSMDGACFEGESVRVLCVHRSTYHEAPPRLSRSPNMELFCTFVE